MFEAVDVVVNMPFKLRRSYRGALVVVSYRS